MKPGYNQSVSMDTVYVGGILKCVLRVLVWYLYVFLCLCIRNMYGVCVHICVHVCSHIWSAHICMTYVCTWCIIYSSHWDRTLLAGGTFNFCFALDPAGLQHFGTQFPVYNHCLNLELSIFSGWMEWPQQDAFLSRKDACTQTYPPRRRIRRAQVQGAGKSVCQWVRTRWVDCSC